MKIKFIILILFFCTAIKADWIQTNGVYGGPIQKVFPYNGNIFIGIEYGGIYVSSDNGNSFVLRNSGLPDLRIISFTAEGNSVFALTQDSGIFRTTNNGLNWISANSGLQGMKLLCVGSNGTNIFAGTKSNGIFMSANSGLNWININNGLAQQKIQDIAVSSNTLIAICGNGTNSTIDKIASSTNNGLSWQITLIVNSGDAFTSIASSPTLFYVGGSHGKLYKSGAGLNWLEITFVSGLPIYSIALYNSYVFLGTSSGLNISNFYYSTNGGFGWYSSNINQYFSSSSYSSVNSIAIHGTDLYAGLYGDDDGLFKSTNFGQNWFSHNRNIIATEISELHTINNNIFCATKSQGIAFTTDNGTNWTYINNGINSRNIISFGSCDSVYFTGTYSGNYRSTNYGANWIPSNAGFSDVSRAFISNNGQIMGLAYAPYKSTDHGQFWFGAGLGYTSGGVGSCFTQMGTYTYTTNEYRIFLSPNFGTFWVELPQIWGAADVTSMTGKDQLLFAGVMDSGIYRNDSIASSPWTRINNGLTSRKVHALHTVSNKILAGTEAGMFVTTNNGGNWLPLNNGLSNLYITSLISNSTYLFAGTKGGGVWKIPLSDILTNVNNNSNNPQSFYLSQNYPNPFNPNTIINYSIPSNVKGQTSDVRITLYDILGNEVAVLVNEMKRAGRYNYQLSTVNYQLSSGIYFYVLSVSGKSGNFSETKRMVLLK